MTNKEEILQKRFNKLKSHYTALKDYKELIKLLLIEKDIYKAEVFINLIPQEKAILDAYLKRFSSLQDFMGAKIFPLLLELAGISNNKMSEVLYHIEKEEIIDSLGNWIELREIRNELEHDYPENLENALNDLKFCINHYKNLESYYINSLDFARKYINEIT